MYKTFCAIVLFSIIIAPVFGVSYSGSTTAAVNLAAGIIKAQHVDIVKKYKRSECPVCKGKGWYISGDDISKVPCGYCEPDKGDVAPKKPLIIRRK